MDLKRFDNQCVRITTTTGEVFEGVVSYCNREYVFHEYGYDQEALHLVPVLLCKDDIAGGRSNPDALIVKPFKVHICLPLL